MKKKYSKKILILGAGISHIPMLRTAKKMGLYTIVMDKDKNALGFKFCHKKIVLDASDKELVLQEAQEEKVDGILSTGDFSVVPAAYATEKLGLPSLGFNVAKLVTNKLKLFQRFKKHGIKIPKSFIAKNLRDAKKIVKKLGFPIILKPEASFGGSRGIIRVNSINELKKAWDFTKKNNLEKKIIVEKFLDGIEHTIESITINGKTKTLAISDKKRISDKYCVGMSLEYPSLQNRNIQNKLKKLVKNAVNSCGIKNGVTHIESISYKGNVYIIDFGARGGAGGYIPAQIVPELNGIQMMENMIRLCIGKNVKNLDSKHDNSIIYRFFKFPAGRIKRIRGQNKIKKFSWLIDIKLYVKKGDVIKHITDQLSRPGFFVVKGKNYTEVSKRAKMIEEIMIVETN